MDLVHHKKIRKSTIYTYGQLPRRYCHQQRIQRNRVRVRKCSPGLLKVETGQIETWKTSEGNLFNSIMQDVGRKTKVSPKFILVIVFWPEVSRRQDVEGQNVWVYDGLIRLRCVSNTPWKSRGDENKAFEDFFTPKPTLKFCILCI